MNTMQVQLGDRSYPIYMGAGNLSKPELLTQHIKSKQVVIVTNETIAPLYLQQVTAHLQQYQVEVVVLPDGEQYKTLATMDIIFSTLLNNRFSRNATLIALGGGVVGDISGFAAACYQRGIPFIQIPTTLLAQVDSSVGGKTGVNHALGKNMIGAFYQPQCVIIDVNVLQTLDDRQFSAGLAEVIKYGLIRDAEFFTWIEDNIEKILSRDEEALTIIIEQSCRNKAEIVASDERESGIRAILNLGHTFGHAIETGMGYGRYLHGEAVAIGTCQAADLSKRLGWLDEADVKRIVTLFKKAGLPTQPPTDLSAQEFIKLMAVDKKNADGDIRLILLKKIGEASLPISVDKTALLATLNNYGRD
ncbi:3-dehydroquinate synthase [Methylococcaceae bacterium HT1]|nr:3-dehydroquinate synthase [Methyloprofundus sp.]TXK95909.1 3-dehydroquinate synthase [Methylococcaceae bacterium CS5]TXK96005.1 3-dehydroquinate synthase [Methylococcaceae bacterium CS4]TXK97947.1 3-dehydroquinate synthase [Methylococcaceae bacterium HT1]TXL05447.1 3-dehydroquinate synthase [Methylococcaceae bacterium CS1]TXL05852.1 3-dehydroquinate synthase [Methylococcaceae bacterium CS3]TXL10216.1 3-dehydroquinate synthase [Methylococcaceae bacterium CS2]TXL14391.1 3-dehydroquinate syn